MFAFRLKEVEKFEVKGKHQVFRSSFSLANDVSVV